MKSNGVMIGSEFPKTLGEFYTKVFGKPGWQQDDWYGFDMIGGKMMIGAHSEVKGKNDSPARIMMMFETSDLNKEFGRLKELGATVVAQPYQPSPQDSPDTWLATVADPDGNYLQLSTPWKE